MNLLFLHHSYSSHPLLKISSSPNPKSHRHSIRFIQIQISSSSNPTPFHARDRVVDFGKHKGRMLGTLPSTYLKWISNNLRARDYEHWANLADEVLTDPIYRDRIEWEFADRLLNGDVSSSKSNSAVSELLEISTRFGWDNDDKIGWKKINYALLGTSRGGRIPRVSNRREDEREVKLRREKVVRDGDGGGEEEKRRRERRERRRSDSKKATRSEKMKWLGIGVEGGIGEDRFNQSENDLDLTVGSSRSPFPGRESLFKGALNRRRL